MEAPDEWKWGIPKDNLKKIEDHIAAIHILKDRSLKGAGVIGAYHARRVAPLMTRALLLYLMAPGVSLEGMAVAEGVPSDAEIARCIKGVMEPVQDSEGNVVVVYSVPSHPPDASGVGLH